MATHEDIENLTVEEFMDGLDYAVQKKKHKLIKELKAEAEKKYPEVKKTNINDDDYSITDEDKEEIRETMNNENRKNINKKSKGDGKMKTWKLVAGILSIILSAFVLFQSMFAGLGNALSDNGEVSGTAGLIVSIMLLAGGIVSIAVRNKDGKGGNIAIIILYGIGALIGFTSAGSFGDLYIWSAWCLINVVLAIVSILKMSK